MHGVYVNGKRPKSKQAVKEAVARDPQSVRLEATAIIGQEYDGPAADMPAGLRIAFVGPDPYQERRFYGTLSRKADGTLRVA
jgi:hypothetical protein